MPSLPRALCQCRQGFHADRALVKGQHNAPSTRSSPSTAALDYLARSNMLVQEGNRATIRNAMSHHAA